MAKHSFTFLEFFPALTGIWEFLSQISWESKAESQLWALPPKAKIKTEAL
jgi:hypothetical protein